MMLITAISEQIQLIASSVRPHMCYAKCIIQAWNLERKCYFISFNNIMDVTLCKLQTSMQTLPLKYSSPVTTSNQRENRNVNMPTTQLSTNGLAKRERCSSIMSHGTIMASSHSTHKAIQQHAMREQRLQDDSHSALFHYWLDGEAISKSTKPAQGGKGANENGQNEHKHVRWQHPSPEQKSSTALQERAKDKKTEPQWERNRGH